MRNRIRTAKGVLEMLREQVPEFDWLKLDRIDAIQIIFQESEVHLLVPTEHPTSTGEAPVFLDFCGIKDLHLPVISQNTFSFGELVVNDVRDRQMEGIRIQVEDMLTGLSFYCRAIRMLDSWPEFLLEND